MSGVSSFYACLEHLQTFVFGVSHSVQMYVLQQTGFDYALSAMTCRNMHVCNMLQSLQFMFCFPLEADGCSNGAGKH